MQDDLNAISELFFFLIRKKIGRRFNNLTGKLQHLKTIQHKIEMLLAVGIYLPNSYESGTRGVQFIFKQIFKLVTSITN